MIIKLLLVICDDVDNSAALRLIFKKKVTIFFCFQVLFPVYSNFEAVLVCVDVRKMASVLSRAGNSGFEPLNNS